MANYTLIDSVEQSKLTLEQRFKRKVNIVPYSTQNLYDLKFNPNYQDDIFYFGVVTFGSFAFSSDRNTVNPSNPQPNTFYEGPAVDYEFFELEYLQFMDSKKSKNNYPWFYKMYPNTQDILLFRGVNPVYLNSSTASIDIISGQFRGYKLEITNESLSNY